jgi:hypothetical protein
MPRFHHFLHYQADATHTSLFACIISVEVIHEMWGRHVKQSCHTVIWQRGQAGETVGVTMPIIIQLHSVPLPRIWNAIMRNQEPENKRILAHPSPDSRRWVAIRHQQLVGPPNTTSQSY